MNNKINSINCFLFTLILVILSSGITAGTSHYDRKREEQKVEGKLSADGPYILYRPNGSVRIVSVGQDCCIVDTTYSKLPNNFKMHIVDHTGKYSFDVKLHPLKRPAWKYLQPEKIFVMSDPHGRLDCVISLLYGNGVIDKSYNWSFGNNHLVVIGDVFDRGKDVIQIFWLLYKLEKEAEDAGGHVSFLLGNHEAMVLANDLRYTKNKYKLLAHKLGLNYPQLLDTDTELGRWFVCRNVIQVIGSDLFVHAGLSKSFYDKKLNIPVVNKTISESLFMSKKQRSKSSPLSSFLYGESGPLWYRGLVLKDAERNPIKPDTLQMIMTRYSISHIIVGHTIFKDIRSFYDRKVIGVNVDNKKNCEKKRGRGILIYKKKYYVVGDDGIQHEID